MKALEDDLALTLSQYSAIVHVPINKNYVVVDVANEIPEPIVVELAMEELHQQAQIYKLPLFLGESAGIHYFADLAKMPHILIGGKAETGKTTLIHTMMRSLKATKTSDELAFVVLASQEKDVAGYRVMMEDYTVEGLDIITTAENAVGVLNGLAEEMDERYDRLAGKGIRNIADYNAQIEPMPYLVVIADEFAPFITAAGKDFEYPLTRLAQLGRAVGIHLIIATSKCTTNIVTGLIKANVPARIAFQTEKQLDSKVILDAKRAVLLLPKNDIYFYEGNELIRIQTPND